jgi:hypothetical protein
MADEVARNWDALETYSARGSLERLVAFRHFWRATLQLTSNFKRVPLFPANPVQHAVERRPRRHR